MRRTIFLVALLLPSAAFAKETLEWIDILGPEAVGELRAQTYDERIAKNFVGTRDVAGLLVGGGIGVRPVFRFPSGVRFSIEASGTWGRQYDAGRAFSYSTVTRAEFLTGLGYELHIGKSLALHTATLMGLDAHWMDSTPQYVLLDATANAAATAPRSSSLERINLRLGQQVGAHLQLANAVALYADGSIDYDGQWRVRAGIAIGKLLR